MPDRYDGEIPYISEVPADGVVNLGTVNDPELQQLIIAVETPDADPPNPAVIQYGADGTTPCYKSIGDLYAVLKALIDLSGAWAGASDPDLTPMMLIRGAITQVYQAGGVPTFALFSGELESAYAEALAALAPESGGSWEGNIRSSFTHTDNGAMHGVDGSLDFGSHENVHTNQGRISDAVHNHMPPGNPWSDAQKSSFDNWDGS